MPVAIKRVVEAIAKSPLSTPEGIESLVQTNFSRLIANDSWVSEDKRRLLLGLNPKR
jgi:hypothetical protein